MICSGSRGAPPPGRGGLVCETGTLPGEGCGDGGAVWCGAGGGGGSWVMVVLNCNARPVVMVVRMITTFFTVQLFVRCCDRLSSYAFRWFVVIVEDPKSNGKIIR